MISGIHPQVRLMTPAFLVAGAVTVVYMASVRWWSMFPSVDSTAVLIEPAAGIALAAIWILEWPAVFGVMMGALLANFSVTGSLAYSGAVALGNALPALAACRALRGWGIADPLQDPGTLFRFMGTAVLSVPALNALAAVLGLWAGAMQPTDRLLSIGMAWWAADAMGVMVWTPALLAFRNRRDFVLSGQALPELLLLAMAFGLLAHFLFLMPSGPAVAPLSFAALPLFVWAALRFPLAVVALLLCALSTVGSWATAQGLGPFAGMKSPRAAAHLHLFLFAVASVGLALNVTIQAFRRSLRDENAHAERLAVTLRSIGDGLIATDAEGRVTLMNAAAEELTGWRQQEASLRPIREVFRIIDNRTGGPSEVPVARLLATGAATEWTDHTALLARNGTRRYIAETATPVRDQRGKLSGAVIVFRDVTERRKTESRLAGQARLLAKIATEASLENLLEDLTRFIDELEPGIRSTVLLADNTAGVLRHAAGLGMPDSFNQIVDGLPIREGLGSCGTAAARGEPVIVTDIQTNPLWKDFRDIGEAHGIRACWSFPIRSGEGVLLGTFALYHAEPISPRLEQLGLIRDAVSLGAMVIERHRDAQRRRDSEEQFRATFEQAAVGVAHLAQDGRWLRVNGKLCDILGYAPEELLASSIGDISHPSERPAHGERLRSMLAGTIANYAAEHRFISKDGQALWINLTLSLVHSAAGEPRYFIAVVEDIADKKLSLEQLRESRDRLARQQASLLSLMDNKIFFLAEPDRALGMLTEIAARTLGVQRVNTWRTTEDGKAIRCVAEFDGEDNRSTIGMELLMEACPAYLETVSRLEAVIADDVHSHPAAPELLKPYLKPFNIGAMLDVPVRLFGRFCGVLCVEHVGSSRCWNEEDRFFALSLANLVSLIYEHWERVRAESALRASELSLRETLQNAPNVAVQWYDDDSRLLYWNPASESLYGWSEQEAMGRTRDEFMLEHEQAAIFRAALLAVLQTGKPIGPMEYLARHRDGSPLIIMSTLFAIPGTTSQTRHVVCMDVDMTERKRTEAALRHRDRILEMVAAATERLLGAADWADEMETVLAHVGLAADVDRVCVYENREDGDEIWSYQRFEWTDPNRPESAFSTALQSLPLYEAGFGRWVETLRRGEGIAGKLREFPCEEQELLAAANIQSMALAPIFARDRWWGFIGFSVSQAERLWSAVELDALKAVANNLGSAIGRQEAETSLRLAATAFETSEGIMITDARGTILRVNHALCVLTGYTAEELVGKTPILLRSDRHGAEFYRALWNQVRETGYWEGELWNRGKDGWTAPHWVSIKPVMEGSRTVSHYVATFLDISERKQAEQEIAQLAYYDALTGLPNRRLLVDRLQHAVATGRRTGSHGALMFVDLDHFKHLNDAMGHLVGDMLLKQVAERMNSVVRENDTIGRLGGDEFVVLLESLSANPVAAANEARRVAEKIVAALNRPFALGEYEHHVSASLGVALFPDAESTAEDILKRADTAMYRSKAGGRNTLRFFEPEMQTAAETRLTMEKALRDALTAGEFTIYLQPQVQRSGAIAAVEALMRWARPGAGIVAPCEFMAVAEESGLIVSLGEWVLEAACDIIRTHREAGRPQSLSVNISPREFRRAEFVERVRGVLDRSQIDPAQLTLELTENAVIEDVADAIRKMSALRELGVRFAIDDFGTGYSSLAYLKQLPVSEIKIDRSFVADVMTDPNDAAIVDAILAMGDRLGLKVVAEGVELEEQAQFLKERGCRFFQGYLYSPPLPVEEYFRYLQKAGGQ